MSQRMTDEQVETIIAQAHADVIAVLKVTLEERVVDRTLDKALRACFSAGNDQGQAIILERADKFLEPHIAGASVNQLGKSIESIMRWVNAKPSNRGRLFFGAAQTHASVFLAEDETDADGMRSHYEHGSDYAEALSKLATWCNEHTVAHPVRDTEPAPAEPTLTDNAPPDALELCENRATVDAAMQAVDE